MNKSEGDIREKRKKQLKRQTIIDKIKGFFIWIVAVFFFFGVAVTFIQGCFGTFIKSADEPQDDYEEYIHSKTP
jgi:hypothetical protein